MELVDDFVRDQLADCSSYLSLFEDVRSAKNRCSRLKKAVDDKLEQFTTVERRQVGPARADQAKGELEIAELAFYEANLLYQIVIINLHYESIQYYKLEKHVAFLTLIKEVC